jgi:hypothetical protein
VVQTLEINKEHSETNIYHTQMFIKTQEFKIKNPTEKQNFQKTNFRAWRKEILTGRRGSILFSKIPKPIHTCRGVRDEHFKRSSGILKDGLHKKFCVQKVHFWWFSKAPRSITRSRKVIDTWNKKKKASPYSSYYSSTFGTRKNANKNFDFFCVFSAAKKNTNPSSKIKRTILATIKHRDEHF